MKTIDKDTYYFIEIDLITLKIVYVGFDNNEELLDRGRQNDSSKHRLFITKGQYNKLVSRCENELSSVM